MEPKKEAGRLGSERAAPETTMLMIKSACGYVVLVEHDIEFQDRRHEQKEKQRQN